MSEPRLFAVCMGSWAEIRRSLNPPRQVASVCMVKAKEPTYRQYSFVDEDGIDKIGTKAYYKPVNHTLVQQRWVGGKYVDTVSVYTLNMWLARSMGYGFPQLSTWNPVVEIPELVAKRHLKKRIIVK